MTNDEFADAVETAHQALVAQVVTVTGASADNVFDRIVIGPEGDIWSGLIADDSGNLHTWFVLQGDMTPGSTLTDGKVAPTNTFYTTIRFTLLGYYRYASGTSASNNEKIFRRIRAKLTKHFMEKFNLDAGSIVMDNDGFRSRFGTKRLSDLKLGYEIFGTLDVTLQPVGRV